MKAIIIFAALLCSANALAADLPAAQYAGVWLLDKAGSSGLPPYYERVKSHTITNTVKDGHIEVAVEVDAGRAETDKVVLDYPLDGSTFSTESKIRGPKGWTDVPTTLRATLGAAGQLHIEAERTINFGGTPARARSVEDWDLAADGKTLIIHRVDDGTGRTEMVFHRL